MSELRWDDERLAVASDSVRTRAYRKLQSRWREVELGLPPGTYTAPGKPAQPLGSRLPDGAPPEAQLLSNEAVTYARRRLPQIRAEGGVAEPARLWQNLLSSQPMCFSLFGHLDAHRQEAAELLNRVLPWPIDTVDDITVECAPQAAAIRLGGGPRADNTAFDALVRLTGGGVTRLIGVETKYTEPFSQKEYEKASYRQLTDREGSWFTPGAADQARGKATNQLWRNLLLAQESAADAETQGAVIVLSTRGDRGAVNAVAGMSRLLREPDEHLAHVYLEDMMGAASAIASLSVWAQHFTRRYLDLTPVTT